MENVSFGILTILFASIVFFYSWKHQTRANYTYAILLLLLGGIFLRAYTSADLFLHPWDERYHALVAKNMIHHPFRPTLYDNPVLPYNYKNGAGNHIWLHKQPMPLWAMAASMWLFGTNEIALRLPSVILSTIGIWLTFSIGSFFFSKRTGYLAAFFYAINGLIIELSGGRVATDHVDIFFLFFIELSIYLSIQFVKRKSILYNVFAGIAMGAAILSKYLPALIVVPIWLFIVVDSGKFKTKSVVFHLSVFLAACAAISLPWQFYIFKTFPLEAGWEASFNIRHITESLDGRTGSFFYFIDRIRINYGELIYLPVLWFLWKTMKSFHDKRLLAVSIWFLVPLLFFSLAKTKMQGYILFTAPALFLITSDFYFMLHDYKRNHKQKWLFCILMVLLIVLPIRYSIERIKPFSQTDRSPQWVIDLKQINDGRYNNAIVFNYDHPIEAMFYTDFTVYSAIPEREKISGLIEQGYTVILNDNGNIPADIRKMEGLIIEKIPAADRGQTSQDFPTATR
ncbi:MAG: glycosyltransferase family 39 protein [Bacteroidota bacterium]